MLLRISGNGMDQQGANSWVAGEVTRKKNLDTSTLMKRVKWMVIASKRTEIVLFRGA